MARISCFGRFNEITTFSYEYEYEDEIKGLHYFRVRALDWMPGDCTFEARYKEEEDGTLTQTLITANDSGALRAKGIPEQLLPLVRAILSMNIKSSPRCDAQGNWRTDAATKMWNRLVERKLAQYNEVDGIYILI